MVAQSQKKRTLLLTRVDASCGVRTYALDRPLSVRLVSLYVGSLHLVRDQVVTKDLPSPAHLPAKPGPSRSECTGYVDWLLVHSLTRVPWSVRHVSLLTLPTVPPASYGPWTAHQRLREDSGIVFANETGGPLHVDGLKGRFRRLVASGTVPRIRFHDLRYTSVP